MRELWEETPCEVCGVYHEGRKRNDPGAGCWAKPGGSRRRVRIDYAAFNDRLFNLFHETLPEDTIDRFIDAALVTEEGT